MSTRTAVAALVALSIAQLGAASWSIVRYESILRSGTQYRIQVSPIYPSAAFRGRYVAVQPAMTMTKPLPDEVEQLLEAASRRRTTAYVLLETGQDGFAQPARVVAEPPGEGDYLRIQNVLPVFPSAPTETDAHEATGYRLEFPFDRYYVNERAAPEAERTYRERTGRDDGSTAWITVRVKDGSGVIEGLFVDGQPVERIATP